MSASSAWMGKIGACEIMITAPSLRRIAAAQPVFDPARPDPSMKRRSLGSVGMSRFLPLAAAVESTIRDGDAVAMEGFTHLIPFAAGHEVIRQRRRHLTLIRMTPDLIYDQLIGMGCADKLVFSWVGN